MLYINLVIIYDSTFINYIVNFFNIYYINFFYKNYIMSLRLYNKYLLYFFKFVNYLKVYFFNNFLDLNYFYINLNFFLNYNLYMFIILKVLYKYIFNLILKLKKNIIIIKKKYFKNFFIYIHNFFIFQFKSLMDIFVIDFIDQKFRFEITYNILSIKYQLRLFIKIFFKDFFFLNMDSLNFLYNSSIWLEREIWDMFGIFFVNNIDLRRILTDYGFIGFPLRKDFPLSGYIELKYDDISKYIIVDLLELSQDVRIFNLIVI